MGAESRWSNLDPQAGLSKSHVVLARAWGVRARRHLFGGAPGLEPRAGACSGIPAPGGDAF